MNFFSNQGNEYFNPLDSGVKCFYALTLQIPFFKKVNMHNKYLPYGDLSQSDQKEYILTHLIDSAKKVNMTFNNNVYFEQHKDGRIHAHTFVECCTFGDIECVRSSFCDKLGIRAKQYAQVFHIFIPDSIDNWKKYCVKSICTLEQDLAELNKKNNI